MWEVWVPGVVVLLAVISGLTATYVPFDRVSSASPLWHIPAVTASYTEIAGVLAALSLASAVFIAAEVQGVPGFETSIGLFVLSFLILVAAAMQFASTPSSQTNDAAEFPNQQNFSYVVANCSFYLGIALSWLGLRLILIDINLRRLPEILTWVLLFSILAGACRICMHLYRHTHINAIPCSLVPAVGFASALGYRGLVELWGDLWPNKDASLLLSTVAFAVAGVGYISQTLLLAMHGDEAREAKLLHMAPRWLVGYAQCVITVVVLVWLSVADV